MSWTASSLIFISVLGLAGCATQPAPATLLFADDFASADAWVMEAEQPAARVVARDGLLDIDTPAGLTLWFKPRLTGAIQIEFEAAAVAEGGPNDQVSDLNVFWMATNPDGGAPMSPFRAGRFEAYNDLRTYYVGLGGNRNTTTRFRRYIGDPEQRPLLAQLPLPPLYRRPGAATSSGAARSLGARHFAGRQSVAAHHAGRGRIPHRIPPGWANPVLPRGSGALYLRLVCTADHEEPPSLPAIADPFTVGRVRSGDLWSCRAPPATFPAYPC
jgi:hypothetical protein